MVRHVHPDIHSPTIQPWDQEKTTVTITKKGKFDDYQSRFHCFPVFLGEQPSPHTYLNVWDLK